MNKITIVIYQKVCYWALIRLRKALKNDKYLHSTTRKCVTAHARRRYIERIYNLEAGGIDKLIAPPEVKQKINEIAGNGKFKFNGLIYVVVNNKILTLYPAKESHADLIKITPNGRITSYT